MHFRKEIGEKELRRRRRKFFVSRRRKKNGRRKRRKMSEDGKTGAMQLLWIMIASRVGR